MKLYKFRSLADDTSLNRAEGILNSGLFWCSRFWELNDPMEGVYRLQSTSPCAQRVFDEKAERLICSFSGKKALRNSLMWGYYSNGFKGIAIELEVDDSVRKVIYTPDVVCPDTTQSIDKQVDAILCNKLNPWKHEAEYRFLTRGHSNLQEIGTITAVVLGVPYPKSLIPNDREHRMTHLTQYRHRLQRIEDAARLRGIRVHLAALRSGSVEINLDGDVNGWGAW